MSKSFPRQLRPALRRWWSQSVSQIGLLGTGALLIRELWGFLRDSTPARRRQRYGDMDFDWEHHVNTTSGTIGWRERLLGVFLSPYQPTDPALFSEMMASLAIDFREFTFIDLGSGKGRTLLMASEYGFRRVIGVEILPGLHRAAQENVRAWQKGRAERRQAASLAARGAEIECVCGDALECEFPAEPIVLYLFNPISEAGLLGMLANLERSSQEHPGKIYVLYHNPLLEHVLARSRLLKKVGGTHQFAIYVNAG